GEERHEDVARPGMPELLEALVRRDRIPQPQLRVARELRRGLLAEEAEEIARALELRPSRRIGVRQQPHREPGHDRVDTGLEQRDPEAGTEDRVDEPSVDARG